MCGSRKHPYHSHYDVQFYQTQICKFGGTNFDTPTVSSRDEVLISFFILLQVFLCSRKFMKLPKSGILVNKTTYLFITIREPYFQWVCTNFGNSGGEGRVIRQIPSVGLVWIFSETTKLSVTLRLEQQSCRTMTKLSSLSYSDRFLSRTLVKTLGTLTQ